ncbi:DNA-processing protein DprA [Camelimonas abortus]|uniref:DNA-processing protein DprA n=1 Tax=Camelimonas abortus TaxID=1017184 RepID=A0ABV7LDV2_9HYPH
MTTSPARLLDDRVRADWLRLLRTQGVGPRSFFRLLDRYGGAAQALEALPELAARAGRTVLIPSRDAIDRELDAARRLGVRFVARGEADYPPALRFIDSPPPLLAVRGQGQALAMPAVAIVGSRNASAAGQRIAALLAGRLGEEGYAVISGLARGVDAAAHEASLRAGTVAVLAGGHDRVYPREHARLLEAILERGAAVSEMPMGWTPRGQDFPRRNRIISGMSLGVVVVEATLRSGSLITARFAAEQGREVFAVPGSPLDPRAGGTNRLLRDGATLCCGPEDVLAALAPLAGRPPPAGAMREERASAGDPPLWEELDVELLGLAEPGGAGPPADDDTPPPAPPEEPEGAGAPAAAPGGGPGAALARVERLLGPAPVAVDDLVALSGLSVHEVSAALCELALQGRLEHHGAQAVSLAPRA